MKCESCGIDITTGHYTLISKLCDDCYEKEQYFTPDFEYPTPKQSKTYKLQLDEDTSMSTIDFFIKISDFEKHIYEDIKKAAIQANHSWAAVFLEYDSMDKFSELAVNRHVELDVSYFFADSRSETVPNFEDRKKRWCPVPCI